MISVAMATYNGALYIEKQLNSILMQSYTPDEVIITDDRSTDNTVKIIEEFIRFHKLEKKWFLIQNECNLGYPGNFYKCMSLCKGDLVFLSDQDDLWREDKIERMTYILKNQSHIKLLTCRHTIIDELDQPIFKEKISETDNVSAIPFNRIMKEYLWPGMSMVYRNELFKKVEQKVSDTIIPHDFALAVVASDEGVFYDYDYIGAFHRRHDNNVGREEHKISKILNFKKKLKDTELYNQFLKEAVFVFSDIKSNHREMLHSKLEMTTNRYEYLRKRSFLKFINTVKEYRNFYRLKTIFADIWLITTNKFRGGF